MYAFNGRTQKWLFKSFNLEKINRQTGSKQVMIRLKKAVFPAKAMRLNGKRHYFAPQKR